MPYLRLRKYLLLEQSDVSRATGISVSRISLGERGLITFNRVERGLIEDYLAKQLIAFGYEFTDVGTLEVTANA
jgi:hypothetical protein